MDSRALQQWVEQTIGAALVLLIILDIFLTVLYARIGTGIISDRLAYVTWRCFRWLAARVGRHGSIVLSFCGPVILVLLVLVWTVALTCGTALIIHPRLGTSISAGSGPTATDFLTALYVGGSSMSVVGASDFSPQTGGMRVFFLGMSLIGMTGLSLTLTYLMQVYTALQQRNTLGLAVHLLSDATGDAAEVLARLGPGGQFDAGYSNVADLAVEMASVKEAHHFYPVLFYFRFREPYYSVSRCTLVALDLATLIKSAVDTERYGWLVQSASVTQLWRASMALVMTLDNAFLARDLPNPDEPPDEPTRARWRHRYEAALRRLKAAGIQTTSDEHAGAERYIALRTRWDGYVTTLAPAMAYAAEEVDPAGNDVESADEPASERELGA